MPESLHLQHAAGVVMMVAIDSTRLGPALGGCRWKTYRDESEARSDAIELARAMTRKAAMARLSLGGGKAVVMGASGSRTREQLLAFGDFVESLGGRYVTAADMGTRQDEMAVIRERTEHVAGLPAMEGGCGDPAPFTARGVRLAMEVALSDRGRQLAGAHVAVQGAGSVGRELIGELLSAGASVSASDVDPRAIAALPAAVRSVPAGSILEDPCDVLAPCGPPGVIDEARAARLRCAIVCGAANNPLASPAVAPILASRAILYAPDFVVNAGGLIHLATARRGGDAAASEAALLVIAENLRAVLSRAAADRVEPARAALLIAEERLEAA